jgi:hypothetical protein
MKLEMRVYDLDIRLELEDDDAEDQLAVLSTVKDLLETLSRFEKVNVSITQIADPEDDDEDDDHHDTVVEDNHLSIVA